MGGDQFPVQGIIKRSWIAADNLRRVPECHIRKDMECIKILALCKCLCVLEFPVCHRCNNLQCCRQWTHLENYNRSILQNCKFDIECGNIFINLFDFLDCRQQIYKFVFQELSGCIFCDPFCLSTDATCHGIRASIIIICHHIIRTVVYDISCEHNP